MIRFLLFACYLTAAGALSAQNLVWERLGAPEDVNLGYRTAVIGDVNGDGYDDLLHTVLKWLDEDANQLRWISGKDGSTLRTLPTMGRRAYYQTIVPAGDWNGDGVPDYGMYVYHPWDFGERVIVASGKDDKHLWWAGGPKKEGFGEAILGNLDLDGDGKPDFVVVHPTAEPLPIVHAYANSGQKLYTVSGDPKLFVFGCLRTDEQICKVGDVDKDGCDDFAVGGCEPGVGGGAALLSGRTGKVLLIVRDSKYYDNLGAASAGTGDLDADGVPDFVLGGSSTFSNGVVQAFSSRTGQVLHTWRAGYQRVGNSFSASLEGGIDVDRDGIGDVIIGTPSNSAVTIFSGRDGSELYGIVHGINAPPTGRGYFVAAMRPQPGSPFPLIAVAEPNYGGWSRGNNAGYVGRLQLLRLAPQLTEVYGTACAA